MFLSRKKPRALPLAGGNSNPKPKATQWSQADLPSGLLTDSLNHFRRAHKDSLREIYISSQAAAPLCQANVDSAKAMMCALIEQAAHDFQAQAQSLNHEAAALLAQVELSPEHMEALRVEREAKPEPSPRLSEGASAKTLPEAPAKRRGRPKKQLAQQAKPVRPDDDLRYEESTPLETGRKAGGDR